MKGERLGILIILSAAFVVLFLLIFILSDNPFRTIYFFFAGPFRSLFNFGNMLNASVPLILGALGIIIAMKAGCLNLGGEGQVYLGAFVSAVIALKISQLGMAGVFLAALFGSITSGILGGLSGFLKAKWNVNELISTFLVSCAILPIVNYLVTGPFLDPQTSLISTKKIAENMRLSLILFPSSLNTGFFIALLFVVIVFLFLNKTRTGYEFRMTGLNEMFARYGGINTKFTIVLAMTMSGFLYGLAGSIAVFGTHYAVIKEFSQGLGWSGLTAALIAGFSPIAAIPSAIFISWINAGARIATQNTGLTYEVAYIVQAVIFILSTSMVIKGLKWKKAR